MVLKVFYAVEVLTLNKIDAWAPIVGFSCSILLWELRTAMMGHVDITQQNYPELRTSTRHCSRCGSSTRLASLIGTIIMPLFEFKAVACDLWWSHHNFTVPLLLEENQASRVRPWSCPRSFQTSCSNHQSACRSRRFTAKMPRNSCYLPSAKWTPRTFSFLRTVASPKLASACEKRES